MNLQCFLNTLMRTSRRGSFNIQINFQPMNLFSLSRRKIAFC
jgi:hypothetical protein